MSDASNSWRSEIHGILPHRSCPQVLLLREAAGYALPHLTLDAKVWMERSGKVNQAMRRTLGVDVTTLRYVSYSASEDARRVDAVYVLESHDLEWEPPAGAEWVGFAALADLPLARPEHRALVSAHLSEAESGQTPELRPPWAVVGWFEQAAAWTRSELARLGFHLTDPVEQFKSCGISCILRARTTSGDVYFKIASSLPLFAHEPALMRGLSALYPDHVPAPLSVDEQRRWMLLEDFGAAIGGNAPVEAQEEMLFCIGAMQRDAVARVDDLLAMGCLDRRLDRLAAQVDPLLEYTSLPVSQLTAEEVERLDVLGPRLKAMCAELDGVMDFLA